MVPAALRWRWLVGRFVSCPITVPCLNQSISITIINLVLNQFCHLLWVALSTECLLQRKIGLSLRTSFLATLCDCLSALAILVLISGPPMLMLLIAASNSPLNVASNLAIDLTFSTVVVILFLTIGTHPLVRQRFSIIANIMAQLK